MTIQKEFIERFRRDDFGLDEEGKPTGIPEHVRSSFEQALGIVSKDLYSDDLHFVYELIQNAQDNSYNEGVTPNLKFILLNDDPTNSPDAEGCLCVINNEKGFSEDDIKSICSSGKSTKKLKKAEGFIGEKGIGFKSVFKVSGFPHIYSNGFHFGLLGDDKVTGLSYIIPYWVDVLPSIVKENLESTCILLPLQRGKYDVIKMELERHKPEVTLFLDKLKRVEIHIPSENYEAIFEETNDGDVLTLTSTVDGKEKKPQQFLLSSKKVTVPEDFKEEKREGVKERTISIAFPLQNYNSLNVYGYLPTEMRSGLPFIINADFLLAASREAVNKTKWNDWLFEEIATFVASEIVRFVKSEPVGVKAYGFIPKPTVNDVSGGRFKFLAKGVISALKTEAFVKATDNKFYLPDVVRSISKEFRELFVDAEHEVNWLSEEATNYVTKLKEVGVKSLEQEEEEHYYYQADFVENQDDPWFVKYYLYHSNLKNRDYNKYPMLPIEGGGIETVNAESTYCPLELGDSIFEITGHFFPPVQTLRKTLFNSIKARSNSGQIFDNLLLKDFSLSSYFFEIVIPSVEDKTEKSSISDRKALIQVLLTWWEKLDIEDYAHSYDFALPVILSNNDLILSSSFEGQYVVPEGYSDEAGWEALFNSEEEKGAFAILNQWYLELGNESLSEYFEYLGVVEYPEPIDIKQEWKSELGGYYKQYDEYLNSEFFQNYRIDNTGIKRAQIPLLPSAFWSYESLSTQAYSALVQYLNNLIKGVNVWEKPRTSLSWFYRTNRSDQKLSPFDIYLKGISWLKTTQGFRKPSECFVDDINLRRIFGDGLPYVTIDASSEFLDYLGVKRDAETSTIIGYLKELSDSGSIAVDSLTAIYSALKTRDDLDSKEFTDNAIVYIPSTQDKPAQWCTSAQVIWDDISGLTDDDTFKSLEPHYPEELKYFFVTKLGIKETMDASSYADLWLNLQNKQLLDDRDWSLYSKAFANIRRIVRKGDTPEWLENFKSNAKLYSDRNTWVSVNDEPEPFLPDQPSLRNAFADKIPFIKRVGDHSYEWMLPLVQFLGFECFSEVVEEQLVTKDITQLLSRNRYLTDYSLKLIVRLLANKVSEGADIVEKLKANGLLAALLNFRETEVDRIQVKIFIPHTEIQTSSLSHTVFLDFDQKVLFIKRDVDPDDVRDDLERLIITRVLGDITNRQEREAFEDSISRLLQVGKENRYKKLLDKKPDWHIPRAILTFIDRVIKERSPHQIERELEEQAKQEISKAPQKAVSSEAPVEQTQGESAPENEPMNRGFTPSYDYPVSSDQIEFDVDNKGKDTSYIEGRSESYDSERAESSSSFHFRLSGGGSNSSSSDSSRTSGSPRSGVSKLKSKSSRSKNTASSINQARRSRLMSYVVSDLTETDIDMDEAASEEQRKYRQQLGEKAELLVLEDLKVKGYIAEIMPPNNPGYDIEAKNPETGEILFVEVKGDSYGWSNKGVGISKRQYQAATHKTGSYYLAVVDNLASVPNAPIYICDPVSCITEYRFDSGWAELATPIKSVSSDKSTESILDQMLTYTDEVECQELIKYCDELTYPFPEVGAELQDEKGQVVLENIELLWESEKLMVFVDTEGFEDAQEYQTDWSVFLAKDHERIREKLDEIFGSRD